MKKFDSKKWRNKYTAVLEEKEKVENEYWDYLYGNYDYFTVHNLIRHFKELQNINWHDEIFEGGDIGWVCMFYKMDERNGELLDVAGETLNMYKKYIVQGLSEIDKYCPMED